MSVSAISLSIHVMRSLVLLHAACLRPIISSIPLNESFLVQCPQPALRRFCLRKRNAMVPSRSRHNHARCVREIVVTTQFRPLHELVCEDLIPRHARIEPETPLIERTLNQTNPN